jgi:Type IV secretion system pilin
MYLFSFISHRMVNSLQPYIKGLGVISLAFSTLLIVVGGYLYITSSGNISRLEKAKRLIKNSLIGLVIVISANFLTSFLDNSFSSKNVSSSNVPVLESITPVKHNSGIVEVILKAITGVFSDIISTIASPFLKAFGYFLNGTPLPSENPNVFKLWLNVLAISNALFVLVLILLGMRFMSYSFLGLSEMTLPKLLGSSAVAFLIMNSSIYLIDYVISISNSMIRIISSDSSKYVFNTLDQVVKDAGGYSLAAMIILIIFLILSVILIIYYLTRIISIYLGAILAPLAVLLFLLPFTKDIISSLTKKYLTNIFMLFVHVIILELAGSLLGGMDSNSDPLMATLLGIATLLALIKSPGVMNQMSIISSAPKLARQISTQMNYGMSYIGATMMGAGNLIGAAKSIYLDKQDYISADEYRTRSIIKSKSGVQSENNKGEKK